MSTYLISLSDDSIAEVDCAELTTRQSGDLWCLAAVDPPPAKLTVVAIFAARHWRDVIAKDTTAVTFYESPPAAVPVPVQQAAPEKRFA